MSDETKTPEIPQKPKPLGLREENERLKARIAELETAALAQAQIPAELVPTFAPGLVAPGKFKVQLEGMKSRVVDGEGRISYVDELEVDAVSPADATEKFRTYNGILTTSARFHVKRVEDVATSATV